MKRSSYSIKLQGSLGVPRLPYFPHLCRASACVLAVGLLPLLTACGHSNNAAPPVAASVPPSAPAPKATTAPIPTTAPQNPALAAWKPSAKQFWNGPEAESHVVALTFDAGSDAKAVSLILQTLAAHQVHATFFLTGKFCEKFPKECRAIADAGMELGNHSFSHPHFTHLNDTEIHSQLTRAEAEITKTCGRGARPLFRFPYGDTNKHVCATVASAGYQPIAWTLDSLDSVGKPKSASFVADRIIRKIKPGYITLMHVSCVGSAQALPRIFTYLDKIGAHVVPVSELLLSQPPPTTAARTASHKELHHG